MANDFLLHMTNKESGRLKAIGVVDDALRTPVLLSALEPHRHCELVYLIVGKPRSHERNLREKIQNY